MHEEEIRLSPTSILVFRLEEIRTPSTAPTAVAGESRLERFSFAVASVGPRSPNIRAIGRGGFVSDALAYDAGLARSATLLAARLLSDGRIVYLMNDFGECDAWIAARGRDGDWHLVPQKPSNNPFSLRYDGKLGAPVWSATISDLDSKGDITLDLGDERGVDRSYILALQGDGWSVRKSVTGRP
jgi:hypothetical protein